MNILSIFDYTGNWPKYYRENGYNIIQIDIKLGIDLFFWNYKQYSKDYFYGILAAVPCTDYALSGARWFKDKDLDGRTEQSQKLVRRLKKIIDYFNTEFWVIENPMTRIHKLNTWIGEIKYKFNPCDFAGYGFENERYNKQTWLFGKFNNPIKKRLEPLEKDYPGFIKLGGKSERTKELRSITPLGFSKAFYLSNK
jgi:hypothetical protein